MSNRDSRAIVASNSQGPGSEGESLAATSVSLNPSDRLGFHGKLLLSTVCLLAALGTIFIFSASFYQKGVEGDAFFFIRRQLMWLPLAILAGMVTYHLDYRHFAKKHHWVLIATLILLAVVVIPGVGKNWNQSRRWLPVGPFQFQPSELAKLASLIFIAGFFSQKPERLHQFIKGFLPAVGMIALMVLLILAEPDLGTAVFILGLSGLLFLIAGVKRRYLIFSACFFAPVIGIAAFLRWGMVQHRLLGFLEPEKVFQVKHSLYALGNGGAFGQGLGAGSQKLKFLPEPYSDFILSIIGEEFGFLGTGLVVILFVVLLWSSVGIARQARDYFGFVLASGIGLAIALQAATNIAVVTASAPTKGIPLPLLTFGGSGLCMTLAQVGLLLSINRIRKEEGTLPEMDLDEVSVAVLEKPILKQAEEKETVESVSEPEILQKDEEIEEVDLPEEEELIEEEEFEEELEEAEEESDDAVEEEDEDDEYEWIEEEEEDSIAGVEEKFDLPEDAVQLEIDFQSESNQKETGQEETGQEETGQEETGQEEQVAQAEPESHFESEEEAPLERVAPVQDTAEERLEEESEEESVQAESEDGSESVVEVEVEEQSEEIPKEELETVDLLDAIEAAEAEAKEVSEAEAESEVEASELSSELLTQVAEESNEVPEVIESVLTPSSERVIEEEVQAEDQGAEETKEEATLTEESVEQSLKEELDSAEENPVEDVEVEKEEPQGQVEEDATEESSGAAESEEFEEEGSAEETIMEEELESEEETSTEEDDEEYEWVEVDEDDDSPEEDYEEYEEYEEDEEESEGESAIDDDGFEEFDDDEEEGEELEDSEEEYEEAEDGAEEEDEEEDEEDYEYEYEYVYEEVDEEDDADDSEDDSTTSELVEETSEEETEGEVANVPAHSESREKK